MADRSNNSWIGAGILGGLIFAGLLFLFGLSFWTFLGGMAGFVAGFLIFQPKAPDKHDFAMLGISKEDLNAALAEGASKLGIIRSEGKTIENPSVRKKVDDVTEVIERILKDIENDPKDLRRARQFFSYYLDATINIVKRYADLSRRGSQSAALNQSLERTESTLDTLKKAYDKQLTLLLEDDVMDLDAELELLERTIKMEGLADDER